jgi:hypothetical protein
VGLRDRALMAVMTYTFARVGAVVAMRVRGRLSSCFAILVFVIGCVLPRYAEAAEAAKVVPWMNAERLLSECSRPVESFRR